jgi:hypothetical protein
LAPAIADSGRAGSRSTAIRRGLAGDYRLAKSVSQARPHVFPTPDPHDPHNQNDRLAFAKA